MPDVPRSLHPCPVPQPAGFFCFWLDLSTCPGALWRRTRVWGTRLSQSFQLRTCVRDELRVTRGSCLTAVTCESRCLETKRTNNSLYWYRCVKYEPWFPKTDPGMSLVMFKGSHSILYGPRCSYAG